MSKEIREIKCNVSQCAYNKNDTTCCAGHIEVGPSSACTCSDTICATFEPSSSTQGGGSRGSGSQGSSSQGSQSY